VSRFVPDTTYHVLEIPAPTHPLSCEPNSEVPDSARKAGVTFWMFDVGPAAPPVDFHPRGIDVAFDSTGKLLILVDRVTLAPVRADQAVLVLMGGQQGGRVTTVRFDSVTSARMEVAIRSGSKEELDAVTPAGVPRDMTPAEISQAHTLADWLWQHRCKKR